MIFQQDDRSPRLLRDLVDGTRTDGGELDHWERDWYQRYLAR